MVFNRMMYVFTGGVLGGLFRITTIYGIEFFNLPFITATFIVNMIGPFLLGLVYNRFENENYALFFITGCLGAFTTFSSLTLELSSIFERGDFLMFLTYMIISMIFGLIMFILGFNIQKIGGGKNA